MPLPVSNSHGKPWGKLDHHKMCPKDTIKGLAKDTRGNLESCFSKAEKSLGGSAVMLLPRTISNPLPNSGNYYVLWFIGYFTGCDRARSLWIDNMLLTAAVCHLLTSSTGQLRIVKCHWIQVFVSLGGAIRLSAELGAASMLTLQSSTSTSIKVRALDGCIQVAAFTTQLVGCSVSQRHVHSASLWRLSGTDAV